ncbi:MAG: HAD family phosphatase [Chloroflexota bacterium]|nr:HAD family phosphatase [Chloroflexota bacterium]
MFEGVIFDLDGLIVDGDTWQLWAWNEYLKRYETQLSEEEWEQLVNLRAYDIAEVLRGRYNLPIDPLTITEERQVILLELVEGLEKLEALPGALDVIEMLKNNGIKLAIATPAYKDYVWLILEKLGLDEMFDVLVTGDILTETRPRPTPLIACAETFALHPANCLALAKDRAGVEAAITAGMRVICVPAPTVPRWRVTGADIVLFSLDALNLTTLRSIWFANGEEPRPQLYRIR